MKHETMEQEAGKQRLFNTTVGQRPSVFFWFCSFCVSTDTAQVVNAGVRDSPVDAEATGAHAQEDDGDCPPVDSRRNPSIPVHQDAPYVAHQPKASSTHRQNITKATAMRCR